MRRILVGLDDSTPSRLALGEALRLARQEQAVLKLVHVVDVGAAYWACDDFRQASETERGWRVRGGEVLERGRRWAAAAGTEVEAQLLTAEGQSIGDVIVEAGRRWRADLIVTGTHGRSGVARLVLGSVAERVRRLSPVAVLIVGARQIVRTAAANTHQPGGGACMP